MHLKEETLEKASDITVIEEVTQVAAKYVESVKAEQAKAESIIQSLIEDQG